MPVEGRIPTAAPAEARVRARPRRSPPPPPRVRNAWKGRCCAGRRASTFRPTTSTAVTVGSPALMEFHAWRGCAGGDCDAGLVRCGNECIDVSIDPDHCGGCENDCDDGEACVSGICETSIECGVVETPEGGECPGECDECDGGTCVINCIGEGACEGDDVECPVRLGVLHCLQRRGRLRETRVECPSGYACEVWCLEGDDACNALEVQCSASGTCDLRCGSGEISALAGPRSTVASTHARRVARAGKCPTSTATRAATATRADRSAGEDSAEAGDRVFDGGEGGARVAQAEEAGLGDAARFAGGEVDVGFVEHASPQVVSAPARWRRRSQMRKKPASAGRCGIPAASRAAATRA